MSAALEAPEPGEAPADSGVQGMFRFLEANLASLRLSADAQARVRASEPLGRVEHLEDGSPFIQAGTERLGLPIGPAEIFSQVQDVESHHVVVVFGVGTGQVVRAVRAMCRVPIVVYEPDPALLRSLLEYGPLDLGELPLACGIADLERVWREFAARLIDVRVVTTPGYVKAYPDAVRAFVEAIPSLLQRTAISKATYQNRARTWVEDIIDNVELLSDAPPFLTLTGRYAGVPAFIVGAGPSLDKNIQLLSEASRKGILFATNSGAVSLGKHGVTPQVVCCIESIDSSSKLAELPFIDTSVRAFSLSAAPRTLRTGKGPLLPVHEAVAQYNGPLQELTGHGGLPMSGSVSTVAMSLARVLGCSPIVLVGQDLAYSGGRTYATGTGYEGSRAEINEQSGVIRLDWNAEALRVHGESQGAHRTEEELRRVPAWGGQGEVDSGAGFAGVQHWFESTAELLAEAGSSIRLINASEGGVQIAHYEELPLARVLEELPEHPITAARIAADARAAWEPISSARVLSWLEAQARAAREVRRVARRLRRYADHAGRVTLVGRPERVTRVYDRLDQTEAELRRAVAAGPLVDAWSHRAIDVALLEPVEPVESPSAESGPHRTAQHANQRSSRVARAIEQGAGELEQRILEAAARVEQRSLA